MRMTWKCRALTLSAAIAAFAVFAGAAQAQSTAARNGRFVRGTGNNPSYQSFVIPLDLQKGVALANIGGNNTNWAPFNKWTNYVYYHYDATNSPPADGTNARIAFTSPIVAFGSRLGGSPLYAGQQYRFGAHAGENFGTDPDTGIPYDTFVIEAYDRRSNFVYAGSTSIYIPTSDETGWDAFASNDFTVSTQRFGLKTTVAAASDIRWGSVYDSFIVTHEADSSATNYLFHVLGLGYAAVGGQAFWLVDAADGVGDWSLLYTVEFEPSPPSRKLFISEPHFAAELLPPEYVGKSVQELTNLTANLTNQIWITNSTSYVTLDQSPELRRHPVLDKFVTDMRSDPLALTEFVLNEIELTDAIALGESGQVPADSIQLGGINRSALGTFLERQGSPWEQCALLVYLLRAAGHPAAYVFPTNNNLKMLDSTLAKLLRMQIKGAVDDNGVPYTTNSLITVKYPWVVANINSNQVVHIVPWLKDTEVSEGFNLYDYMPANYDSGLKWSRQYLYGDTNIFQLGGQSDVPRVLLSKFIENTLLQNYPGISSDDIGVRFRNRRRTLARWSDLPKPNGLNN